MKRIVVTMMLLVSFCFAYGEEDTASINKEVTGVNMEVLEQGNQLTVPAAVKGETFNSVETTIKSNDVQMNKEKLDVASEQDNSGLEDELSKKMSSNRSVWKYILGAVLVIITAAAL